MMLTTETLITDLKKKDEAAVGAEIVAPRTLVRSDSSADRAPASLVPGGAASFPRPLAVCEE